MPSMLQNLAILRYPRLESFNVSDANEVVMLVAFLEDRHVRAYDVEERAPLRKAGNSWHTAFEAYLSQIGCPFISPAHPYNQDAIVEYLTWLVYYAVGLAYEDKAAELTRDSAAALAEHRDASAGKVTAAAHTSSMEMPTEAAAMVHELAALLHVPSESRDLLDTLQAVHRAVRQRVLPIANATDSKAADASATSKKKGGSVSTSRSGGAPGTMPDLSTFPLGFATGNAVVDKAAAILRMLYVSDLRELQDEVNSILVTVQEFTANPKTDASLGSVGR